MKRIKAHQVEGLTSGGGGGGVATEWLHLGKNAPQSLAGGGWRTVTWQVERADSWGGFDPAASQSEFTVNESGLYLLSLHVGDATQNFAWRIWDVTANAYNTYGSAAISTNTATQPIVSSATWLEALTSYHIAIYPFNTFTLNGQDTAYGTSLRLVKLKA